MTLYEEEVYSAPGLIFGYLRVSTLNQKLEQQQKIIQEKFPKVCKFFKDSCSGKDVNRPGLQLLLEHLRDNDTIVVESLSRISRSTSDLLSLLKRFKERNIKLISVREDYDFSTATGKLLVVLLAGLAEMERDLMLERQREGIAIAKLAGKYKGRKRIKIPDNFERCLEMYLNRENNYKIKDFMKDTGLKQSQLFKFKKQFKQNKEKGKDEVKDGVEVKVKVKVKEN